MEIAAACRLNSVALLIYLLQKMKLLGFPVLPEEKEGKNNPVFVKKLPNVLAFLALHQLKINKIYCLAFNTALKTSTLTSASCCSCSFPLVASLEKTSNSLFAAL